MQTLKRQRKHTVSHHASYANKSYTKTTKEAVMGFGGGYSSPSVPEVTPVPKQEVQKPVTEAATAARQAQKDKASKAAGIGASVYTSPLDRADGTRKTLLGQ